MIEQVNWRYPFKRSQSRITQHHGTWTKHRISYGINQHTTGGFATINTPTINAALIESQLPITPGKIAFTNRITQNISVCRYVFSFISRRKSLVLQHSHCNIYVQCAGKSSKYFTKKLYDETALHLITCFLLLGKQHCLC